MISVFEAIQFSNKFSQGGLDMCNFFLNLLSQSFIQRVFKLYNSM